MATEQQQLQSSPEQRHLERGHELLLVLQHAARAARLEAQVAELQAALTEAELGDAQRLSSWLAEFDEQAQPCATQSTKPLKSVVSLKSSEPKSSTMSAESTTNSLFAQPITTADTTLDDARQRSSNSRGWDGYLEHARQRLEHELCDEIEEAVQVEDEPQDLDELEAEHEVDELALAELELGKSQVDDAPQGPLNKRTFGSMGFSLVGHAALFMILGTITYRPAQEAASLGAQVLTAAEARDEVELTQELEMLEPVELDVSTPTPPESQSRAPSDLAQMQQAIDVSVPSTTAQSSAGIGAAVSSMAASAAQSAGGGSRNGSASAPKLGGKFFGVGTGGNYFCYVVDSSGSMRGEAWESAKLELLRSLGTLKSTQQFYIVFFAKEMSAIPDPGSREPATRGLYATPENIAHARRWIDTVKLGSGGPPNDALAWAIDREPDAIYLLTDGVTRVDVCRHLREINRLDDFISGPQVRVPIHAIAYYSLEGQQLMRQLANENKGQFHYVPDKRNR